MGRLLGDITNANPVSRYESQAVPVGGVIDNAIHLAAELLKRGTLMAKIVSSGKFRAYFEATVKAGGDFANNAVGFTLDAALSPLIGNLRVGDVIESVGGTALGTIATFNATTGVGTLTGNSANNLAAAQKVRITEATVQLGSKSGRILKDEVLMGSSDEPFVGWIEGFFIQARTTITAAALTALGGKTVSTGEIRLI